MRQYTSKLRLHCSPEVRDQPNPGFSDRLQEHHRVRSIRWDGEYMVSVGPYRPQAISQTGRTLGLEECQALTAHMKGGQASVPFKVPPDCRGESLQQGWRDGTVPVLLFASFLILTPRSWFSTSVWALTQQAFTGTWFVLGTQQGPSPSSASPF